MGGIDRHHRRPSDLLQVPPTEYTEHPAPSCLEPRGACTQEDRMRDHDRRIIVLETDSRRILMVVEGLDTTVGHLRDAVQELKGLLAAERRAREDREHEDAERRLDEAKAGRDWVGMVASAVLSSVVPALLLAGLWLLSRPGLILPKDAEPQAQAQEERR